MTKIADFHTGKQKFIKGKMPKDRSLDGIDFNVSKEHEIADSFLNAPRKKYNQKLVKKHIRDLESNDEAKFLKLIKHYNIESKESLIKELKSRLTDKK